MSNLIISNSDLSFYCIGLYERIPDISSFLNELSRPELDFLRDLYRAQKFEELKKALDMLEDKVRGYIRGYIQVCLYLPRSPLKPISRTLIFKKCSIIRLLQKNELLKTYSCRELKNIPIDYKKWTEEIFIPKFLKGELVNLINNRSLYLHDAFKDNFKAFVGLYFMTKKKILPRL